MSVVTPVDLTPRTPAALISLADEITAEADNYYEGVLATEDLLDLLVYADGLNGADQDNQVSDLVGEIIYELAWR